MGQRHMQALRYEAQAHAWEDQAGSDGSGSKEGSTPTNGCIAVLHVLS